MISEQKISRETVTFPVHNLELRRKKIRRRLVKKHKTENVLNMAKTQSKQSGGQKPLDDLSYDLVTLVYEKSKGLEAYEKYMKDAKDDEQVASLLEELKAQDAEAVERIKTELIRVMGAGSQS